MAENATRQTTASVDDVIAAIPDSRRREEAAALDAMLRRVTGTQPAMWGPSIIGYGAYRYRQSGGREGEMCRVGFAARKAQLVVYLPDWDGAAAEAEALYARLGRHSRGAGCLNIKRLADIDASALEQLLALAWRVMADRYGAS